MAPKKYGISKAADCGRVRAVHGVGLDGRGEILPDRPRRGLGGIGRAHEVPQARDGVLPFQHDRHARPLRHEGAEAPVERALLVHDVEASGLGGSEMDEPGGQNLEAALLEAGDDLPDRRSWPPRRA